MATVIPWLNPALRLLHFKGAFTEGIGLGRPI